MPIKNEIQKIFRKLAFDESFFFKRNVVKNSNISKEARLYAPYSIHESSILRGTYLSCNARISMVDIGKFCSIGPNFLCGYGIHPINGISTSPAFYSTAKQNGISFCTQNKIAERKRIKIGNDVFIGMNVIILDGLTIGDGAVIAAGSVVAKNVEPYAVVGGVPAKHIKYRFTPQQITQLLEIKWWDWQDVDLEEIEKNFFEIDKFLKKFSNKTK
jgi:acetyltransferase-like isoleucine patch superfamily enzyme